MPSLPVDLDSAMAIRATVIHATYRGDDTELKQLNQTPPA
jgi:hypothetical protein